MKGKVVGVHRSVAGFNRTCCSSLPRVNMFAKLCGKHFYDWTACLQRSWQTHLSASTAVLHLHYKGSCHAQLPSTRLSCYRHFCQALVQRCKLCSSCNTKGHTFQGMQRIDALLVLAGTKHICQNFLSPLFVGICTEGIMHHTKLFPYSVQPLSLFKFNCMVPGTPHDQNLRSVGGCLRLGQHCPCPAPLG